MLFEGQKQKSSFVFWFWKLLRSNWYQLLRYSSFFDLSKFNLRKFFRFKEVSLFWKWKNRTMFDIRKIFVVPKDLLKSKMYLDIRDVIVNLTKEWKIPKIKGKYNSFLTLDLLLTTLPYWYEKCPKSISN